MTLDEYLTAVERLMDAAAIVIQLDLDALAQETGPPPIPAHELTPELINLERAWTAHGRVVQQVSGALIEAAKDFKQAALDGLGKIYPRREQPR